MGQPIAGSNPALSATLLAVSRSGACRRMTNRRTVQGACCRMPDRRRPGPARGRPAVACPPHRPPGARHSAADRVGDDANRPRRRPRGMAARRGPERSARGRRPCRQRGPRNHVQRRQPLVRRSCGSGHVATRRGDPVCGSRGGTGRTSRPGCPGPHSPPHREPRPDRAPGGEVVALCYHHEAVLGGELAVPCTCNPLQQG